MENKKSKDKQTVSASSKKTGQSKQKNRKKNQRGPISSKLSRNSCEGSSSDIIPSNSEVTSNLKRSLQNDLNVGAKIKKIRENNEEKLKIISSNNENDIDEEFHISSLIEKLDEIVESVVINIDEHHDVSNESNYGTSDKNISVNGLNNTGSNNQEICSSNKISVSKEGNQNIKKKSNNVINDTNNCVPQVMKINTKSTENNDGIENNHQLISPLSMENLVIEDNSKDNDVDGDVVIIKSIKRCKNYLQMCKRNNTQMSTNSTSGIETVANESENKNNEVENEASYFIGDCYEEMNEPDNVSGNNFNFNKINGDSSSQNEISSKGLKHQCFKNMATQVLYDLFSEKNNIYERWMSFVHFKCLEYLTDKDIRGRERREAQYILQQQQMWAEKFVTVFKSLKTCSTLISSHSNEFQNVPRKTKVLRSVALQVNLCSFKEDGSPLVPLQRLKPIDTVDISSDDDVILVEEKCTESSLSKTEIHTISKQPFRTSRCTSPSIPTTSRGISPSIPSTSKSISPCVPSTSRGISPSIPSTSKSISPCVPSTSRGISPSLPSTSKSISPSVPSISKSISPCVPSTSKKLMVSNTKAVPPGIPLYSPATNIDFIDLTENDEVNEVPRRLNLDNTLKIIRRPIINTSASVTPSTQSMRSLPTQALSDNLTFIKRPKLQTSPNDIVKISTALGSNRPTTASSLKTMCVECNSSSQPIVIKSSSGKLLQLVDPNQLQPNTAAILTPRQLNDLASQINSSKLFRSHLNTPEINRSQLVVRSAMPRLTMVQRPQLVMNRSTRPQQTSSLPPVPPAIPLVLRHPAPLPPLPNQTSLPSWKKLPSAPVLTVTQERPSEVLLSWVVPRYTKPTVATITTYQIYAYLVIPEEQPSSCNWTQIGTADALHLPMACSITKLERRHLYYFAVRAVDIHTRVGPFSLPKMLALN